MGILIIIPPAFAASNSTGSNSTMSYSVPTNLPPPSYMIQNATIQNPNTGITVTTDRSSYNDGDKITISGTVSTYVQNTLVTEIIRNPAGNIIKVDQIAVDTDKTFSDSVIATGLLWQSAGTYTISAIYGSSGASATTSFQFSGSGGQSGPSTIPVDGTSYSISYTITNGKVLDIKADPVSKSLTVSIQTTGDGLLTITTPRALIDATNSDGTDTKFVVLNDGQQNAQATEIMTTNADRTLAIPFKNGAQQMVIVGTELIGQPTAPISPPVQSMPSQQQIQLTSGGTIDVGFSTSPSSPTPGSQANLLINFINKSNHAVQQHIDYKVAVMEGSNQICGTQILHTALGSITIPCQFQSTGTYQVTVYVDGILFQPIPEESTTFSVTVGSSSSIPRNCPATGCVEGGDTLNVVVTPTTGASPLTVSYKASFAGSSVLKDVTWNFGDGNSASGVMSGTYTYQSAGTYTGTVDVDATDGTSYTQQFTVQVTGTIGANVLNATVSNPNNGTMNAYKYLQHEATANQSNTITVTTDKQSYVTGDTIAISGKVNGQLSNTGVVVRIVNPSTNMVSIAQFVPGSDGSFSTKVLITGPLWTQAGTYTVIAQNGPNISTTATFYFSGGNGQSIINVATNGSYSLSTSAGTFNIPYTFQGGTIQDIEPNPTYDELTITVQVSSPSASLELTIPRTLLDSKQGTNDIPFIAVVDGTLANMAEQTSATTTRTISLQLASDNKQIGIIGTSLLGSQNGQSPALPPPSYITSNNQIIISNGAANTGGTCSATSCFNPQVININPGSTVTWTNDDTVAHTATSGRSTDNRTGTIFDSSLIRAGSSFTSPPFNTAGTYNYFCMVHPWMTGEIIVGQGSQPSPTPTPPPTISTPTGITVSTDKSSYSVDDTITSTVVLAGANAGQNIAISITDPTNTSLVARTITTDSAGTAILEVKLPTYAKAGNYQISATASVNGQNFNTSTTFTVQQNPQAIQIVSVQATDQQGNPVSSFTRGTNGYVKVLIYSPAINPSLTTVNLFDSNYTAIGIGSLQSSLGAGQSETTLSFPIPNDAVTGTANIYVDMFSDWPDKGGKPLTPESSTTVEIK